MGFEKATMAQAFIKSGWYGDTGSGKTFTSLQIATMIGPTAMIATERAMDFYADRFDYNIHYTVDLNDATEHVYLAVENGYKCLIVDQISHFWESAQDTYIAEEHGKMSKAWGVIERTGNLPFYSWKKVKRPYKKFIRTLMDAPIHVFLLGRMSREYQVTGEDIKVTGERMNAEKETPYEPHILVKMEFHKPRKWLAWIEKDHSGTIQGKVFENPDGHIFDPILAKLGKEQGQSPKMVEDTSTESISDERVKASQITVIKILAKKGGLDSEIVDEALGKLSALEAGEIINKMTMGDYSALFNKEEG